MCRDGLHSTESVVVRMHRRSFLRMIQIGPDPHRLGSSSRYTSVDISHGKQVLAIIQQGDLHHRSYVNVLVCNNDISSLANLTPWSFAIQNWARAKHRAPDTVGRAVCTGVSPSQDLHMHRVARTQPFEQDSNPW